MRKTLMIFAVLFGFVLHGQEKREYRYWIEEGLYHYSEFDWETLFMANIWAIGFNYDLEGKIINDSLVFEYEIFSPGEIRTDLRVDETDTAERVHLRVDETDTALYEFVSIKIPMRAKYTELKYSKIEIRSVDIEDSMLRKSVSYPCAFNITGRILRFWTCRNEEHECVPWETEEKILHELIID